MHRPPNPLLAAAAPTFVALPLAVLIGAVLTAADAPSPPAPAFDPHPARPAEVIKVHDGDTILVRLSLDLQTYRDAWIRFEGVNTPELHGPNPQRAREAAARTAELLRSGAVWVKPTGVQTFARWVGRVYVVPPGPGAAPIDVAATLRAEGFDVPQGQ